MFSEGKDPGVYLRSREVARDHIGFKLGFRNVDWNPLQRKGSMLWIIAIDSAVRGHGAITADWLATQDAQCDSGFSRVILAFCGISDWFLHSSALSAKRL
jgi:hypothetical protein